MKSKSRRFPWWVRDASIGHKRLFMAGAPRDFWNTRFKDIPKPVTVETKRGYVEPEQQSYWMKKLCSTEELNKPYRVLIFSNPTDDPGLALMTVWARVGRILQFVDIAEEDLSVDSRAVGLYNLTGDSSEDRVERARDLLYRFKYRFVALVVSGVEDPLDWMYGTLRVGGISAVFRLDGSVRSD